MVKCGGGREALYLPWGIHDEGQWLRKFSKGKVADSDKTQMAPYSAICDKVPHPDPKQHNTCLSAPLDLCERYSFVYPCLNYPNMPTDYSELQHPCGHPGCKQFFKTTGGQTKHMHIVHMSIPKPSPSPPTSPSPPHGSDSADSADEVSLEEFEGLDAGSGGFPDDDEWDQESFGDPNEEWPTHADVNAQFYGSGNLLYRNYCIIVDSMVGA